MLGLGVDMIINSYLADDGIPRSNLLFYAKFDGNTIDETGNHSMTFNAVDYAEGLRGVDQCVFFDDNEDYILIPDSDDFSFGDGSTDSAFSISLEFKFTGDGGQSANYLLHKRGDNGTNDGAVKREWGLFRRVSDDKLILNLWDQSSGAKLAVIGSTAISDNTTYHLTITYDGSSTVGGISMYLDGSAESLTDNSSGTYTAMENFDNPVVIGSRGFEYTQPAQTSYLLGYVDGLGIWNKELSSDEVTAIYNLQSAGADVLNNTNGLAELITFGGSDTSADYGSIAGISKVNIFSPSTSGVDTYNHIPWAIEHDSAIHVMFATGEEDEEGPGQYVRYSKSTDGGATWSTPVTLLEEQDDGTLDYLVSGGRVCVPSGFIPVGSDMYAVVDVNDRSVGPNPRTRTGVGVLAIGVGSGGFETPVWIENVDGSTDAPTPISGYPSYSFNSTLRTQIRNAIIADPTLTPQWYYSVPTDDLFYSRGMYEGEELVEPCVAQLPNGKFIKNWRNTDSSVQKVIVQMGNSGFSYEDAYITDIPDDPSRKRMIKFSDDVMAVCGNNQAANRQNLYIAFSSDGFTYGASNDYTIDIETTGATYSGDGKTTGSQYPHVIELANGKVFVVYSVNKEDIECATFTKPTLV
jgi:hypothetical protein